MGGHVTWAAPVLRPPRRGREIDRIGKIAEIGSVAAWIHYMLRLRGVPISSTV
jgi:hypothetical protein